MAIAICSECGSPVEIAEGEEWGYCHMCENDQVEVVCYKNQIDVLKKHFIWLANELNILSNNKI